MAVGRQFGREASIYLAGYVGAGVIQFASVPIYSRALGPEQFGQLTLTLAATTALAGVMLVGGELALARFWPEATTDEERRVLASTWIAFLTCWSVIVAVVAALAAPWLSDQLQAGQGLGTLLVIGVMGLVPAQFSRMLAQVLRNEFRPVPFALTWVAVMGFNVSLGIALGVVLGLGVTGVLLGLLAGESLGALIRLPLVWGTLTPRLSRSVLKPLLRFGLPLVPASLAAWVFTGADRLVVGAHFDETTLGIYGLATTLVGPFTVFTLAMGQAWIPRISAQFAADSETARSLTAKAVGWALAGLGSAALAVGALGPWLVTVVGGPRYADGAVALPFLALGSAFAGTALFSVTGLTLTKRTWGIPLATGLAALVDITLLHSLVPRFGLTGAAVAVALSYMTLAGVGLLLADRAFPLGLNRVALALITGVLLAQSALSTVAPRAPTTLFSLLVALTTIYALAQKNRHSAEVRES